MLNTLPIMRRSRINKRARSNSWSSASSEEFESRSIAEQLAAAEERARVQRSLLEDDNSEVSIFFLQ